MGFTILLSMGSENNEYRVRFETRKANVRRNPVHGYGEFSVTAPTLPEAVEQANERFYFNLILLDLPHPMLASRRFRMDQPGDLLPGMAWMIRF